MSKIVTMTEPDKLAANKGHATASPASSAVTNFGQGQTRSGTYCVERDDKGAYWLTQGRIRPNDVH